MEKENVLRQHQLLMLSMLKELDRICKKHNIKYMLFAGSMLGAVRHKGFIPWDDDLDVVMLRDEYEKFLLVAEKELDKQTYFLQKENSPHWHMHFSKLRKNNTACIERYIPKDSETHMGIYIDIFPCDNLSDSKILRKMQFFSSKVVIAKSLDKRGYLTDSKVKKMFQFFCKALPSKPFSAFAKNKGKNKTQMVHTFFGGSSAYLKAIYPRKWLENTILMQFEDSEFPVSEFYDELLTTLYGEYMTPLPESQRGKKVHAEIIDLENSYEKYKDEQKNMKFEEYSRSIR